jgi:hypothetical protein
MFDIQPELEKFDAAVLQEVAAARHSITGRSLLVILANLGGQALSVSDPQLAIKAQEFGAAYTELVGIVRGYTSGASVTAAAPASVASSPGEPTSESQPHVSVETDGA